MPSPPPSPRMLLLAVGSVALLLATAAEAFVPGGRPGSVPRPTLPLLGRVVVSSASPAPAPAAAGGIGVACARTRLRAASDGPAGETEEERRRRILALQNEIAEDILAVSEEEREAAEAKKIKLRQDARRAIYQAYNKVGGEVSINEIGVPKKMTKLSKTSYADDNTKVVNRGKSYAARKFQLQFDSLWLSALGLAAVWAFFTYEASLSYGLGAVLGFGYITLLGRSVEALGKGGPGAGVGQARFAMVILLVLLAGKYRDTIQLIPAIVGFSTYQVASFLQAFERDDPSEGEGE